MKQGLLRLLGKLSGAVSIQASDNGSNYGLHLPGNLPAEAANVVVQPTGIIQYASSNNAARISLNLSNNWVNYDTQDWGIASAIKRNGIVYLSGVIKGGSVADGAIIFQLPFGYRPHVSMVLEGRCDGNGHIRLDILASGACVSVGEYIGLPSNWISLSTISFPTL